MSNLRKQHSRARRRVGLRGWIRRLFFFALIAVTAYLLFDRIGVRALAQAELVASARAWESGSDPVGSLIYEGDETQAAILLGEGGWRMGTGKLEPSGSLRSYDNGLTFIGGTNRSRQVPSDVIRSVIPPLFDRFHTARDEINRLKDLRNLPTGQKSGGGMFGGGGGGGLFAAPSSVVTIREEFSMYSAPIFAHARRAADGIQRVVLVQLHVTQEKSLYFRSKVLERFGVFDSELKFIETPAIGAADSEDIAKVPGPAGKIRELVLLPDDPKKGVRLYAVQPDAADTSRFFFDYEVNGKRGTIEGKLQADDTIQWQVLSGPAADPNWHADKLRPTP